MQRLFPLVICWLICRDAQTIDYVIVQTPDPFLQNFISRTDWNSKKFWTMNTQNLSTLQVFQSISHKCKSLFLQSCPKEFIRFLCECIINLLKGNLQSIKRHHVANFQSEVRLLSLKRTIWKQGRDILACERRLQLINVNILPLKTIFLDMDQFVLNPASVYNKSLITRSTTKQELPKYQPSQNPTYLIDSLIKDINKKLFSKADSLVDNFFVLSTYQVRNFTNFISGWCRNWNFPVGLSSTTAS